MAYGDRLPESLLDALEELVGTYASPNFVLAQANATTIQIVATTDNGQVGVAMNGRWRYITATVQRAHPGGAAGTYDIWVVASDNAFLAGTPETDNTVYAFDLRIVAHFATPVTGSGATALGRKVGELTWDGAAITALASAMYDLSSAVILTPGSLIRNRVTTTSPLPNVISAARAGDVAERVLLTDSGLSAGPGTGALDVALSRDSLGPRWASTVPVNAPGYQVAGVALGAQHLTNGTTGSGALALATSPALLGTPTAPTAAVGTSTTQLATTAFVMGQGADSPPLMSGAAAIGVSSRYARQDHVHPTDSSQAPLASPALTGTPTAPTAAVDTNTTQIATTAFVLSQVASVAPLMDGAAAIGSSFRYARQDHVHPIDTSRAPLASPGLTGTPTAPTAAADTSSTQIATTAFVIGQAAVVAALMDGSASIGSSFRYARQDHVHPTDTSRAPLASPALTGVPTAPTAAVDTNTTQLATTAFVLGQTASKAPLASPVLSGTPTAPSAAVDTSSAQIATTAFVIGQAGTASPAMDGAAAAGSSSRYARQDHVHPSDTSRLTIPGGIAAGETVVYNGSSFVRSTSTLIGVTSLGSGSPSVATYLRGDGTWAPLTLQINSQPASYTLVLADAQKIVEVNSGGTLVIPPNSSVAFPVGTNITVVQTGAGQVTLTAGGGVTLRAAPGAKLASQWAMASLYKRATDEWVAGGNLIP